MSGNLNEDEPHMFVEKTPSSQESSTGGICSSTADEKSETFSLKTVELPSDITENDDNINTEETSQEIASNINITSENEHNIDNEHSLQSIASMNDITVNGLQAIGKQSSKSTASISDTDISTTDTDENESSTVSSAETKLSETIAYQQKMIEENASRIKYLEETRIYLEQVVKDLNDKLDIAVERKEAAVKEKEAMVIRYAIGEKNILIEKQHKEAAEKKLKEATKENEILQHKYQTMMSEKSRLCQMLDNKCYELRTSQQELENTKADLQALKTKLKWSQNNLKNEMDAHKESQGKVETLNSKLQEIQSQIEKVKKDAQDTIRNFRSSEENRAHTLDQQVQEQQAQLILLRHEKTDKEDHLKSLQCDLHRLQDKQKEMLEENNKLSLKVQQLERERLEMEQKLSELRGYTDRQKQDVIDLQAKSVHLEQLKLQLKHEQDQLAACNEQVTLLKQRNSDLEGDMESCRVREAELLLFTQQLTDKNVRLQSEFTSMESKVQQLSCEQAVLKRQIKEQETKANMLSTKLSEERSKHTEEISSMFSELEQKRALCESYSQEIVDLKGEILLVKRKYEMSLREVNKELQCCRRKLKDFENADTASQSSSNSSSNVNERETTTEPEQVKVVPADVGIDKQTLIEHIVKLQRISAKKSEKIDFLEEHVNTLVSELQKKSKLLQNYILREQTGTMSSNSMDNNKAKLAKLNGIMASLYSSRIADNNLTLELSLDINRKLQAVLEDTLLKNITLKVSFKIRKFLVINL
nr:unnamed protein product [Callosobruchus chinensis]